jgi:hypothetical protein
LIPINYFNQDKKPPGSEFQPGGFFIHHLFTDFLILPIPITSIGSIVMIKPPQQGSREAVVEGSCLDLPST